MENFIFYAVCDIFRVKFRTRHFKQIFSVILEKFKDLEMGVTAP